MCGIVSIDNTYIFGFAHPTYALMFACQVIVMYVICDLVQASELTAVIICLVWFWSMKFGFMIISYTFLYFRI